MRLNPLILCAISTLAPIAAFAQAGDTKSNGTLSFYFENDLFAGTDRYYTDGVKIGWSSPDLSSFSESPYAKPLLPLLDNTPYVNDPAFQKNLTFSVGQNMYTPSDTQATSLLKSDRPYAGWLYGGVGFIWKNADVRNEFVLDVGIVGPSSYAEETQRLVHEARGIAVPRGWDNQLHDEIGVVGVYQRTWRWPHHDRRVGLDWECLPHIGLAVGNVADYANAGGEVRFGLNLPDDFGAAGIDAVSTTPSPVDGAKQASRSHVFDFGAYLFGRVDGKFVARDIFLDGNTFEHSASVSHKWLVADVSVGTSVNYKNTTLTYAVTYRTKEFVGQKDGQLFGSITANLTF